MLHGLTNFLPESLLSVYDNLEFLIRIVISAAFGIFIGLERTKRQKDAGIRTHCIIAVTSAAFMIPAYFLLGVYGGHPELAYGIGLAVLGAAFITPVHVPKPGLKGILVMALIGLAEVALFILASMGL